MVYLILGPMLASQPCSHAFWVLTSLHLLSFLLKCVLCTVCDFGVLTKIILYTFDPNSLFSLCTLPYGQHDTVLFVNQPMLISICLCKLY